MASSSARPKRSCTLRNRNYQPPESDSEDEIEEQEARQNNRDESELSDSESEASDAGDEDEDEIERQSDDEEEEENDNDENENMNGQNGNEMIGKDGTTWMATPPTQRQTRGRNILTEKGGPHSSTKHLVPLQLVKLFLSNDIMEHILTETNKKGEIDVKKQNEEASHSNAQPITFTPFTKDELDAFVGILTIAGAHNSNVEAIEDLWKPDGIPLVRAAMSIQRFKLLKKYIRFDDSSTRNERKKTDKAAAIRDVWNSFNSNLPKYFKPHESITIDEQLFPFKGKCPFRVYIPNKPDPRGIRIDFACDSQTSYPLKGILYTGKAIGGERETNFGEKRLLELASPYKNTGRNITADNLYTTLTGANILAEMRLSYVGTVRKSKTFIPLGLKNVKGREVNSSKFAFTNNASICSYVPRKNKNVLLLSTMHMSCEVTDNDKAKPEMIMYYNKTKGGVDNFDKMCKQYTVKRKTHRWPLALFFNFIDIALLAAYIIYVNQNSGLRKRGIRKTFLKDVAYDLCEKNIEARMNNQHIVKIKHTRMAMEYVYKKELPWAPKTHQEPVPLAPSISGRSPVTGSCYICREQDKYQRKTRKMCGRCDKPVCAQHSLDLVHCFNCTDEQ